MGEITNGPHLIRGIHQSNSRSAFPRAQLAAIVLPLLFLTIDLTAAHAEPITELGLENPIRLNTVGYPTRSPKVAAIAGDAEAFQVVRISDGRIVHQAPLGPARLNEDTQETLRAADFSELTAPGQYKLVVAGVGESPVFHIADDVYREPLKLVTRAMYLARCGAAVQATDQGVTFQHEPCHLHDGYADYIGQPGQRIDTTGGWHDAGDYNKYVNNAGISVASMLLAWQLYEPQLRDIQLGVPEAGNGIPELLNEVKWELDWLLKMQSPQGGVYHKVSTTLFGGFLMPEDETAKRFIAPIDTCATANLAGACAMAARIYEPYDPQYAQRLLAAARKAYDYLQAHPDYEPADLSTFRTGHYALPGDDDERLWAAAELWAATGQALYRDDFHARAADRKHLVTPTFDWGNVANLGMFTYLLSERDGRDPQSLQAIREDLIKQADSLVAAAAAHGYARPAGAQYWWGANGLVARQTILLMIAHRFEPKPTYLDTTQAAIDHLLGRNVYGRSFVTGLGHQPPLYPHDRRSGGDNLDPPWPGYLVGGPHPHATDWRDIQGDYRTNEIAINWNAALIFALASRLEP